MRDTPNPPKKRSLQTQALPPWCLWLLLRPPGVAFPDCAGRPLGCPGATGGAASAAEPGDTGGPAPPAASRAASHRSHSSPRTAQRTARDAHSLPTPRHQQVHQDSHTTVAPGAIWSPEVRGSRSSGPCQCCTWARRKEDTIRDLTLTVQGAGEGGRLGGREGGIKTFFIV